LNKDLVEFTGGLLKMDKGSMITNTEFNATTGFITLKRGEGSDGTFVF